MLKCLKKRVIFCDEGELELHATHKVASQCQCWILSVKYERKEILTGCYDQLDINYEISSIFLTGSGKGVMVLFVHVHKKHRTFALVGNTNCRTTVWFKFSLRDFLVMVWHTSWIKYSRAWDLLNRAYTTVKWTFAKGPMIKYKLTLQSNINIVKGPTKY